MILATNKRAYFDYQILKTYEAGIELYGFEVKAAKFKKINLAGSYVVIKNHQAWLINCSISPYQPKNIPETYQPQRTRRLLLHKKEIVELETRSKGLTIVPLKAYTKHGLVKLEIGLAKPRKKVDKRELIKEREAKRKIRTVVYKP